MTDQGKLNPDLVKWLDTRQRRLNVTKTTTTPGGQTLDWIPRERQHPAGKIASPPPAHHLPVRVADTKKPVKPALFELDDPKIDRGPEGTVPLVRPDLSRLARTAMTWADTTRSIAGGVSTAARSSPGYGSTASEAMVASNSMSR
jgi:hypothetical protein